MLPCAIPYDEAFKHRSKETRNKLGVIANATNEPPAAKRTPVINQVYLCPWKASCFRQAGTSSVTCLLLTQH